MIGVVVAAVLTAAPAAAHAATVVVDGVGVATMQAQRAQVIGVVVKPTGRVKLTASNGESFRPRCVKRSSRRCVRYDEETGSWIVLRPVKFIYDGKRFSLRVQSRGGFKISISGVGSLKLNGKGVYTLDGVEHRYDGNIPRIRLAKDENGD